MMKKIFGFTISTFCLLSLTLAGYSQVTIVVHKDQNYVNVATNTAARVAAWSGYKSIADDIQKASDSITVYEGIIVATDNVIHTALTSVSDLEKDEHAVVTAYNQLQDIVKNLATASVLATQKPYLVQAYSQYATYVTGRITGFSTYIGNLLSNGDDNTQMDNQQRDQLLKKLCNEINNLDNYTQTFIAQIKAATFADAVKSAGYTIPFKNNQTQILKSVLSNYKL